MKCSLIDLACRSALLRLERQFIQIHEKSLFGDLVGPLAAEMRQLAHECRSAGEDARASPYWSLLEHQNLYEEAFERNRRVDVLHLTPMAIYQCMERGNQLWFGGWTVVVGGSREVTGVYGEPAWESRIWLKTPDTDSLEEYSGISRDLARDLYARIVGREFDGVDTLGYDDPHAAEKTSLADVLDYMEAEGTARLITSDRYGEHWEEFARLSVEDPTSCSALFDDCGRYLDPLSGFWASLRSERYVKASQTWFRWTGYE